MGKHALTRTKCTYDRCVVDNNNTWSISRYISYVPYERGTLDTKQIINCNSKHNPLYYSYSTADFIFWEDHMAATKKIPVGIENFQDMRKFNFYYIDKTNLIEQLLDNWSKVTLFTRPRSRS